MGRLGGLWGLGRLGGLWGLGRLGEEWKEGGEKGRKEVRKKGRR